MISMAALLTILGMASATYATRLGGYLLLRKRKLGPRARAVMEAAPGCVLISVIAPHFVSPHPEELIALGITLVAAWRLPMLFTVAIAVGSLAGLRLLL
ncbi:putative membrane protein [Pseudomonas sp. GM74]|uniref:AzlD family protein n=1 Tax=Pseudomonas sp. GM74 TaxID=1144336 RepID=UPI000270A3DE|nr:AzlD family protein [Pseudomonas sp. GM74]EJM86742.1 putative membrane protein [Pseudomonas sp. GM74]